MTSRNIVCPHCGDSPSRIKRKTIDRILSLFKPLKRYRCDFCNWEVVLTSRTVKQSSKK